MKIGKMTIHTQYGIINRYGIGDLYEIINPRNWKGVSVSRNITSSGKQWFGWYKKTKRLNVWPFSIWF